MRQKRKRTPRRRGQRGGVAASLPIGIFKTSYASTKAIGGAKKVSKKRWREYQEGKRKRYAGESFNCSIM